MEKCKFVERERCDDHVSTTCPLHSPPPLVLDLPFLVSPMTDSASSPVTADFSSAPPKRTKIVLLGDQSVGKTSLITRYSLLA